MPTQNSVDPLKSVVDGLEKKFENAGFKNFNAFTPQLKEYAKQCLDFAKGRTGKNCLLLVGNKGNGKSHLAVAVLKNLGSKLVKIKHSRANSFLNGDVYTSQTIDFIEKEVPKRGLILSAPKYFAYLNDAVSRGTSKIDLIEGWIRQYDCILLDDLGIDNLTEAKRENLYLLIDGIYLSEKLFVLTTNFLLDVLEEIDPRLVSRLTESSVRLTFTGEDYRLKIAGVK